MSVLQSAVRWVYPSQCSSCGDRMVDDFSFCGPCWSELGLILGASCDLCGVPLEGEDTEGTLHCDDCLSVVRPWTRGRAVFRYEGTARKLVLGLKYGDRTDLAPALGPLLRRAAQDMSIDQPLAIPVPLHWTRTLRRRYNQSAVLVQALNKSSGIPMLLDGLVRTKRTAVLRGLGTHDRYTLLSNAICVAAQAKAHIDGRSILLIDDVMTSGATFTASTDALVSAGAKEVFVLALARATKSA